MSRSCRVHLVESMLLQGDASLAIEHPARNPKGRSITRERRRRWKLNRKLSNFIDFNVRQWSLGARAKRSVPLCPSKRRTESQNTARWRQNWQRRTQAWCRSASTTGLLGFASANASKNRRPALDSSALHSSTCRSATNTAKTGEIVRFSVLIFPFLNSRQSSRESAVRVCAVSSARRWRQPSI